MRAHLGVHRFQRFVRVRNFHGHATEIIKAHCRTIGLGPDFTLPTRQVLERELGAQSSDPDMIAAAKDALSAAKRRPRTDDEVDAALTTAGNPLALSIERARARTPQLHYDDLLRHAQRLLHVDQVANLYQQHFGALLVDEFQDLSPQQLDLALRTCVDSRTFVGDPLQGIYTWAGADPAVIQAELTTLCGEPLRLTRSYRSSPAVLTMLNSIGVPLGAAPLASATPDAWPGGGAATAIVFPTGNAEAAWIADRCAGILERRPAAAIGVIARSGWRRKLVDTAFAAQPKIPCRRWDLAVDDQATIERLRQAASALPRNATFAALRDKAIASLDPSDVDGRSDIVEAVAGIEASAEGARSVRSALRRYLRDDSDQAITPGVHLLNAHTSKGQQFDWVFVPGLEDGHVPDFRASSADERLEERRTLLVMLSRAKEGAAVSRATQLVSKRGKPYFPDPSPWWPELAAAATMSRDQFVAATAGATDLGNRPASILTG